MTMIQALQKLSRDFDYLFGDGEFTIEVNDHKFARLLSEMRETADSRSRDPKLPDHVKVYFQGGIITIKRGNEPVKKRSVDIVWVDEKPGLTIEQLKAALLPATMTGIACSDGRTDSHEPELRGDGWVICKKCGFGCLP